MTVRKALSQAHMNLCKGVDVEGIRTRTIRPGDFAMGFRRLSVGAQESLSPCGIQG